jgi:hypothetical protein
MKKINVYILAALTYLFIATSSVQAAFDENDVTTDYFKQTVDSWFDMGETLDPLTFTDFLVCVSNAAGLGNDSLVNLKYKANADESKCETGEVSSTPDMITMTVDASKTDNAVGTPQNANIWFNGGANEVGEPSDHFTVEYQQTVGVDVTDPDNRTVNDIPFGSFTMSWQHATVDAMRGTLSYVNDPETNRTTYKLYETSMDNGAAISSWIHGSVMNDLSEGEANVGIGADSHAIKYTSVDDNFIVYRQKTGDAAICEDESLGVDKYVYEYNLYDEDTGAFKSLNGPFSGTYVNLSNETKRIHAGPWGIWFEDQAAADRYSVTSITHEDGTVYTGIIFEPNDDGNDENGVDCTASGCIPFDGITVVIPEATAFDQPIIFPYAKQGVDVKALMTLNSSLDYFGKNSLYGLPWYCLVGGTWTENVGGNTCDTATDWRPQGEIANFTTLTDQDDKKYKVKAAVLETKIKVDAGQTACTNNVLTDLASVKSLYAALTADNDVTAVTNTWADRLATGLVDAPLKVEVGRDDCLDANGQSCAGLNGILVTE